MPNHVTNKITFSADKAEEVFAAVVVDGCLDFERLVPSPPNMYHGDLSSEDEKDFKVNWLDWSRINWGTKWGAYDGTCGVEGGKAWIKFDTAWSPPYPVIAAFCNRFKIPFEHRYFDEAPNFWGIEVWGTDTWQKKHVQRISKRKSDAADKKALAMELCGRDLDAESAEDAASG